MAEPVAYKTLYEGDWLELRYAQGREYMVRKRATGIAIITAVTDAGELVLTEQYRVAVGAPVLELPAGMVGDEPGRGSETILEAARRELLEETGFEATVIQPIVTGPISSGFSDETMSFFYTDAIVRKHAGGGDETENITVYTAALQGIDYYLEAARQKGMLIDPKIYIGLYHVRQHHAHYHGSN